MKQIKKGLLVLATMVIFVGVFLFFLTKECYQQDNQINKVSSTLIVSSVLTIMIISFLYLFDILNDIDRDDIIFFYILRLYSAFIIIGILGMWIS